MATQKIMMLPCIVTSALYLPGRDDSETGNMLVRKSQLHAEDVGEEAADQGHRHAREQILHGDHLVIGGPEIFLKNSRLGVMNLRAHRRTSATIELPAWEAGGAGSDAADGFELCISHAAWSCGVSTIIRPAIMAWPIPHICVH